MLLKQGVWYNPHKYIRKIMPEIDKIFEMWHLFTKDEELFDGDEYYIVDCIVTSCGDCQHSIDSMHHLAESKAIDIRPPAINVKQIRKEIEDVLKKYGEKYGITYIILDESNHWHIQVKE